MEENKKSKSKNKILISTILILMLIIIAVATGIIVYNKNNNINVNENGESIIKNQEIENKNEDIEKVKNALNSYTEDIGDIEDLIFDSNYNNDYRFNQTYKGIEVYGGGIVATYKDEQIISLINYNYEIPDNFNISPLNNKEDLVSVALEYLGYENIIPIESELVIYPINLTDFTLAYLYKFGVYDVIVSDSDKSIIGMTSAINGSGTNISTTEVIDENIKNSKNKDEDSVLTKKDNKIDTDTAISNVIEEDIRINYEKLVESGLDIKKSEISQFLDKKGTYILEDKERNLKFYRIKDDEATFSDAEEVQNQTEYYYDMKWDTIEECNYEDNYYSIKAMTNLQKVYDYYNKEFGFKSIKEKEEYNLNVFTNFKIVGKKDYSNNACLGYYNDDDIRIYIGSDNLPLMKVESFAHEYTHAYFNRIAGRPANLQTNSINEAYADIMALIIEAYYSEENDKKIDGIYAEGERVGTERIIRDSNLTYNSYDESIDYHDLSMIVSKVAYLMSINETLDLSIDELANIWFNSLYKLPKNLISYTDVEKAVLLQAKELGYSKDEVRIIADIFVSLEYPDCFDECYGEKLLNVRQVNFLDKDKAIALIKNNNGNTWRDVELEYEYVGTVMDEDGNLYYAINRYAKENFMYYGGEWLEEITEGKFYAGTYYVSSTYMYNKVHVGYNARDYGEYKQGDTIYFFIVNYYLDVN